MNHYCHLDPTAGAVPVRAYRPAIDLTRSA
jgi:hypothetical protein